MSIESRLGRLAKAMHILNKRLGEKICIENTLAAIAVDVCVSDSKK